MKIKLLIYFLTVLFFTIPFLSSAEEKVQIKIVVLPWKINSAEKIDYVRDALYDMISSRMAVEKTLVILKESDVKNIFSRYEKEKINDDILKKVGRELGADYVLYGSITYISETLSLDAKVMSIKREEPFIQSTSQGKGLESLIPIVSQLALDLNAKILEKEGLEVTVAGFGAAPTYVGGFTKKDEKKAEAADEFIITTRDKTKEKPLWKSHTFAGNLKKIDIGDVDGDGRNEVVLVDDHNLYIYRVRGQLMDIVREFKGKVYEDNYSVDVADLNGNGIPEIYVSRITNKRIDSYVVEYQKGEFVKIAENLPWFFKTTASEEGVILMGQKLAGDGAFFRDIKYLMWKEKKIAEQSNIDMPEGLNIYNSAKISLSEGKSEDVVAYTDRDYLILYRKGNDGKWQDIWTSKEYFGGSLNRIESAAYQGGVVKPVEAMEFVDLKSRILYGDMDGDGNMEIVVTKNEPGTLSRYFKRIDSYKNGEIVNLSWEKGGFEENWKTKRIDGYIADFIIKDFDNDGQKELVILVVEGPTLTSKAVKSYLIAYKLNIK